MSDTRPFDPAYIFQVMPTLLSFLDVTLDVVLLSVFFGTAFGMILAAAKLSRNPLFRVPARGYTYVMRCTPAIILLFVVFYGLPKFFMEVFRFDINDVDKSVFVIIAFAMLFSAYISEAMRSAYLSVNRGQYEAAVTAGLTPFQALRHVVLPQAALILLPNFGNSFISILKDGALAFTIGLIDMLGKGELIISQNYGGYGIEIYLALFLIYWVLALLAEHMFAALEKHLSRYRVNWSL